MKVMLKHVINMLKLLDENGYINLVTQIRNNLSNNNVDYVCVTNQGLLINKEGCCSICTQVLIHPTAK